MSHCTNCGAQLQNFTDPWNSPKWKRVYFRIFKPKMYQRAIDIDGVQIHRLKREFIEQMTMQYGA